MTVSPLPYDPTSLRTWLTEQGLAGIPIADLFDGLCKRLVASGFPLVRGHLSFATLHPLQWAMGIVWRDGRVADAGGLAHGYEMQPAWLTSPFRLMLQQRQRRLRRQLAGSNAVLDFPVLEELRDEGLTDWFALLHFFGWSLDRGQLEELGVTLSCATDRPGGWHAQEIDAIDAISDTLALAVKAGSSRSTTRDLLATYLGREAAERVVAGQVRRGSVEKTEAVVLYADLRAFTDFAEAATPEEVTRRLNDCFDAMGDPVKSAGGEILKFLGDGFLAIFRPGGGRDMSILAAAALGAAQEILVRIGKLNEAEQATGNPPLEADLALHAGEVSYGNVGTADRLDFTVIGPAVNQASRLEGMCRDLSRHMLISNSFIRAAPALLPQLQSLGRHRLRGVSEPQEIFGID